MPENLTFKMREKVADEAGNVEKRVSDHAVDTSCNLKLDFKDTGDPDQSNATKESELANNNLHIWELGNLFEVFPSLTDGKAFKLLVPKEIAEVVKTSTTTDINQANIIAALNGPMAHIYVKGATWQSEPDAQLFGIVLNRLTIVLQNGTNATEDAAEIIKKYFPNLGVSIDKILIRNNGTYKVYKGYNQTPEELSDNLGEAGADYVKAKLRIEGLNDFNRSGDIVLVMKDKTAGGAGDRFTTGVACKSWHGSLNPSDSYVPLIVAYPGGTKSTLETLLKRDTVCGDYSDPSKNKCKGNWNLTDIIKELISEQYK